MKKHPIVGIFVYLWCLSIATNVQWRGNILCLMGVPSPSHHIWNRSLMLELSKHGYNLTILTVEIEESQPNLHFITMEDVYERIQAEWNTGSTGIDLERKSPWALVIESYKYYHFVSQKLTDTKGFQTLLNYPDNFKFSAVIHDFTVGQVLLGFIDKFGNPPLISVSPFGAPPHSFSVAGSSHLALFSPHFATGFSGEMDFCQKITSIATHFWDFIYREMVFLPQETLLARTVFPHTNLKGLERRSSLILVSREPLVDGGIPLPANVINVGGLHVERDGWLPPEVVHVLNSSPKSVILFSLGSNMRSDLLGHKILSKFVRVFEKLSQFSIIWKFEGKRPSNWPANILTVDWVDQNKILEHPNVVLFITHGGLLSIQEAAWNGIPILGMPLFMDQHSNIARAVSREIALDIDVNSFTEDELESKILSLIARTKNAKTLAKMWKKQESPLTRAVSWVEAVVENGELDHLKHKVSFSDVLFPIILTIILGGVFLKFSVKMVKRFVKKKSGKPKAKLQ